MILDLVYVSCKLIYSTGNKLFTRNPIPDSKGRIWVQMAFCYWLFTIPLTLIAGEYAFQGKHLIASYHNCDEEALSDVEQLKKEFIEATRASGATILDQVNYHFEPDGMTMAIILSESDASIHTYPEHRACFVVFFTCGDNCFAKRFDESLRAYLKPKKVIKEHVERS